LGFIQPPLLSPFLFPLFPNLSEWINPYIKEFSFEKRFLLFARNDKKLKGKPLGLTFFITLRYGINPYHTLNSTCLKKQKGEVNEE
jgi:hypothetical protein